MLYHNDIYNRQTCRNIEKFYSVLQRLGCVIYMLRSKLSTISKSHLEFYKFPHVKTWEQVTTWKEKYKSIAEEAVGALTTTLYSHLPANCEDLKTFNSEFDFLCHKAYQIVEIIATNYLKSIPGLLREHPSTKLFELEYSKLTSHNYKLINQSLKDNRTKEFRNEKLKQITDI